jgi:hypothetical protein
MEKSETHTEGLQDILSAKLQQHAYHRSRSLYDTSP